MNGGIYIIRQNGKIETRKLTSPPSFHDLHDIINGYIEIVPYWNHLHTTDINSRCVAFCDENGKITGKQPNEHATALWERVLNEKGISALGKDYLVGDIAVVWGDADLLRQL